MTRLAPLPLLLAALALPGLAPAEETPPAGRDAHDSHAIERWIGLPHDRQLLVLQSLGVAVPQEYFNCVCRAAGYGSPGTAQYYHPDTIGEYDKRYSCQHPGPPCIVSGYGCTRHDLPTDPKIFESCAAQTGLAGGNPLDNILDALAHRDTHEALTGNPVVMVADPLGRPPPDCAKARAEAGLAPRVEATTATSRAVPPERMIWALSPELQLKLATMGFDPDQQRRVEEAIGAALSSGVEILNSADEKDLRIDFDGFEIGITRDPDGRVHATEITVKPDKTALGREVSVSFGLDDPANPGAKDLRITGAKFGFSYEGDAGELKYGIEVNRDATARDYYDGEWRAESEYRLVRAFEDLLAKFDFYGGGAANLAEVNIGGRKISIGPEYSWKIKERYSDWLFSDMNEALDDMLATQKDWEDSRHDYIDREAARFGIDARCFATGETIGLVHDAYEKAKATDPTVEAPFRTITEKIAERQRIAEEAARNPKPAPVPKPEPTPLPPTGLWEPTMLR